MSVSVEARANSPTRLTSRPVCSVQVLIRAHNNRTRLFDQMWWREYAGGLPRDQLSSGFCVREAARRVGRPNLDHY